MFDLIGDIHSHVDKLIELLEKLGYSAGSGVYSHPTRKVVFIGDYIDRGPKIMETLKIVRQMVESGNAIALMGNHEGVFANPFLTVCPGEYREVCITKPLHHLAKVTIFKTNNDIRECEASS